MRHSHRVVACSIMLAVTVLGIAFPLAVGAVPLYADEDPPSMSGVGSTVDRGVPALSGEAGLAPDAPPVIDVWYGTYQKFGHIGMPQKWVNILGNVSDLDGIASLVYTLNGGPQKTLSIGPDGRRLVSAGDFNVDIDHADLVPGLNEVVIKATDKVGTVSTETVTVDYTSGRVWPVRYSIDWSTVGQIQDVAQIVDGLWAKVAGGIRTTIPGYDRLVAIGDITWQDYEVTVPVTINSVPPGGGAVGVVMRWAGHTDSPISGWQPKSGYFPLGAIGEYVGDTAAGTLQIYGNGGRIVASDPAVLLKANITYVFKMKVTTQPNKIPYYQFKYWRQGQTEPARWDLVGTEGLEDPKAGCLLLLAHKVDATFGNVRVTPGTVQGPYYVDITPVGQGTVNNTPGNPYEYGQIATLEPVPDPGWSLAGWSGPNAGDLVDNGDGTWWISMIEDKAVTATFAQSEYSLAVTVEGQGAVNHTPGNPYSYGQVATLEPVAEATWLFDGWSGPDAGALVDKGDGTWSVTMDGDKEVTARFVQPLYKVTVTVEGQGTVQHTPGGSYLRGAMAYLKPIPANGWGFAEWGGPDAGDMTYIGNGAWQVMMDGDKSVTAIFKYYQAFLPFIVRSN